MMREDDDNARNDQSSNAFIDESGKCLTYHIIIFSYTVSTHYTDMADN